MQPTRLYIVTRKDLYTGLKAAQICHVALELPRQIISIYEDKETPYVIVLEVEDEIKLESLCDEVSRNTTVVRFREPDLEDQLTSIAFIGNEDTKFLTKNLRLVH